MSKRCWVPAIALGLVICFGALAQEQSPERPVEPTTAQQQPAEQPAVEAQPIPPAVTPAEPPRAEHDSSAATDRTEETPQNSNLIFGDGLAQWVMAISGLIALMLSGWAVWLLQKTLGTTEDTLREASNATEVARRSLIATRAGIKLQLKEASRATDVSQEMGKAQVRAYLTIQGVSVYMHRHKGVGYGIHPVVTIRAKNNGQSPARSFQWSGIVNYVYSESQWDFRGSIGFVSEKNGRDIGASDEEPSTLSLLPAFLTDADLQAFQQGELHGNIIVRYRFTDVFGNHIEDERTFVFHFLQGTLDTKTELHRNPFDGATLLELARLNHPDNLARMSGLVAEAQKTESSGDQ